MYAMYLNVQTIVQQGEGIVQKTLDKQNTLTKR